MKPDLRQVHDQVIVITGASSGIGLATARMAAGRGARVVLSSRDEEDLERAVMAIRAEGGQATHAVADVADLSSLEDVARTAVDEYGRIDTWVNNAGVSIYGLLRDVTLEDARRLFDTNYWGVVHGSLVAVRYLERNGGALINVGSMLSVTAYPLQGHYTASKHAVKGFTDSLRMELAHEGTPITVSLVEPAAIDTPYPQHARSYLGVEPKHTPPVYAPEVVAKAILQCAVHPHRTVRVGGSAAVVTATEYFTPRLGDRIKEATAFEGQRTGEPVRDDDILWAPRPGDGRIDGNYPGRVIQHSAATAMRLHRGATLASLGLVGLGVALALGGRPNGRIRNRW